MGFTIGQSNLNPTNNNTFNQNVKFLCFQLKLVNVVTEYKNLWLTADERIEIFEP